MSWIWKFFITALAAVLINRIVRLALISGFYNPLYNHTPGPCHLVPGVVNGSEDVVTLTNGLTLITSGIQMFHKEEGVKGRVLSFDFNKPADGAKEVTIEGDLDLETFIPVGISAYEQRKSGTVTVFIINRRLNADKTVEVFDFKQQKNLLTLIKTIKDDNVYTPNNIAATGPDSFYLSNDGYSDSIPIRFFEVILGLHGGSVVHYDGSSVRPVAKNVIFPNGVALSHTRKRLYVGSLFGRGIYVYDIEKDLSLTLIKEIHLATVVDNLTVDPDTGDIYAACQLNLMAMASQEGRVKGSAQVLRIQLDKDLKVTIREVLMDDGSLLRGSSVASLYKRHMVIGTVTGDMMFCRIDAF